MNPEIVECNLCGSNSYEVIYKQKARRSSRDEYLISEPDIQKPDNLFKCNSCGLIFAERDKSIRYYARQYANMVDNEYLQEEEGRRRADVRILKRIGKHKRGGRLLDIGCANGFLIDEARRMGWEVCGVEISKWAVKYAQEELELNVIRGTLKKAAFPDGSFDCVVMLDVLEHLPDPRYTLREIGRILKDDGILYISTPDISSIMSRFLRARWWGINKFHLYYFSRRTLEKMLGACGFKVEGYAPHIRIFSVGYWLKRINVHSHILYKVFDLVFGAGNLKKRQLSINLRDQIETIAVKAQRS